MVSSLDKLTKKLKNNLLDIERSASKDDRVKNPNGQDITTLNIAPIRKQDDGQGQPKQAVYQQTMKTFVEQQTKEYLLVATDGCFSY